MVRHTLSRRDARRLAVRAQWLHADRPAGLLELVRHITLLQIDPTAAVAPSAHLVAWSPLGAGYDRDELDRAMKERALVELRATIRPAEDFFLYRADMAAWPGNGELRGWRKSRRDWVEANDACRRDILRRLSTSGPLPSREPILYGDRLVGKLDAVADNKSDVLRVNAIHWDVDTSPSMVDDVEREIQDLAAWLGHAVVRVAREDS